MTGNNKLFSYYIAGEKKYVHAASATQAAVALKNTTGEAFVDPNKVKEEKPLYFYLVFTTDGNYNACGYKSVAAKSAKQAAFLAGKYFNSYYRYDGDCKEANPGTKLGDCFDADYDSHSYGQFMCNININN